MLRGSGNRQALHSFSRIATNCFLASCVVFMSSRDHYLLDLMFHSGNASQLLVAVRERGEGDLIPNSILSAPQRKYIRENNLIYEMKLRLNQVKTSTRSPFSLTHCY